MIVIYTSNIAFYDYVRPPKVFGDDYRFICFSDWLPAVPEPWEVWPIPPLIMHGGFDRGRTSRVPKIIPHAFFRDVEASIYHDANRTLTVPPEQLLQEMGSAEIGFFAHPGRNCLYDEAQAVVELGLEESGIIDLQLKRYRREGLVSPTGLWAGGLIVRKHTPQIEAFNEIWWRELLNYAQRDQVALPYALWKSGLLAENKVHTFPGEYYRNFMFDHEHHAAFEWAHTDADKADRAQVMQAYWALQGLYSRDPNAWVDHENLSAPALEPQRKSRKNLRRRTP